LIDFFSNHAVLFALVCAGVAVAYGIGLTLWLLADEVYADLAFDGPVGALPALNAQRSNAMEGKEERGHQ